MVGVHRARQTKETLTFLDDDIARFMEEAAARRGRTDRRPPPHEAGYYETAFRVLGRYMDEQKPHDVFFFEQEGAFVAPAAHDRPERAAATSSPNSPGTTSTQLVANGPSLRQPVTNPRHRRRARPAP